MLIRRFEKDDMIDIENLYIKIFSAEPWNEHWSTDMVQERLKGLMINPMTIAYVAYDNQAISGALIGHITSYLETLEYYIDEFFVDTTLQRAGIGTAMLHYIEEDLKKENVKTFTLLTTRGYPCVDFYYKNNFKQLEDLIFLYKNL
jgi:ribosomal protein S18 acetylase RimI-like enzyme